MITFYHQIKISISFLCRQELNPRSLIQPLETLPVELTGTHFVQYSFNLRLLLCLNLTIIYSST